MTLFVGDEPREKELIDEGEELRDGKEDMIGRSNSESPEFFGWSLSSELEVALQCGCGEVELELRIGFRDFLFLFLKCFLSFFPVKEVETVEAQFKRSGLEKVKSAT